VFNLRRGGVGETCQMIDSLALINALVFDATGAEPFEGGVVVAEQKIVDVFTAGSVPQGNIGRVIDCRGGTLLPGLLDAHVHVGAIDLHFADQSRNYPSSLAAFMVAKRMETMLSFGYTTVRDAGGADWGLKEAVRLELISGPDLLISCRPISQTGGHGDHRTRSEPASVQRVEPDFGMPSEIADGEPEVRKAVREQLRRGADSIKIFASGGAASPTDRIGSSQYSTAELRAAVEEATAAGTYVLAHALSPTSVQNCLAAGVRSIEHGNFLTDLEASSMAAEGAYLVPTMAIYLVAADLGTKSGYSPEVQEKIVAAAEHAERAVKYALDARVLIGSGSDMVGPELPWMGREHAFKASVMGAKRAIESTTRVNAELFRMEDRIGTITVGKQADLIWIDGNPLEDIQLLSDQSKVKMVIKHGSIVREG
jgi:imidazolonepropionase-like amidohydrolase